MERDNKVNSISNEKRLVTSALPYINNVPHLGHIVGSHLPADIFARYSRTKGYDTLFIGGTDEHGSTSEIAAAKLGVPIGEFSEVLHNKHKQIYDWMGISYDNFSRTTSKIHARTTDEFFKDLNNRGFVYKKNMKVLYSPKEDRFLPDRYVVGTCPICKYDQATGDQCEKCTSVLETTELINPRSALTGDLLEKRDSEHLFFRLSQLSPELEKWIKSQKQWRSQVSALAMGWINEGLLDRCITRDLQYGVKVPLPGFEKKVFYVWFEAPVGYISFTKEVRPDNWKEFWQGDNGKIYNFLGKDNIPFHTIFWPGMVIASGKYNLPSAVVGLQYLNYEGGKFSKSQNRGVFCEKLLEAGIDSDTIRGALIQFIPETSDAEFKWDVFQNAINSDLLGNFGNLVNRTVSFVNNKLDGEVSRAIEPAEKSLKLALVLKEKAQKIGEALEAAEIRSAFKEFLLLSTEGNKYFDSSKVWEVVKQDRDAAKNILYDCVSFCASLAIVSSPFLPTSAQKIWEQLNIQGKVSSAGNWDKIGELQIPHTHKVNKPELLYKKIANDDLEIFKAKVTTKTDIKDFFLAKREGTQLDKPVKLKI